MSLPLILSACMTAAAPPPSGIGIDDVRSAIESLQTAIIDAHHPKRHWDPPRMPSGESTRQHLGGYTALAALALLTSGADAQQSPLRESVEHLRTITPTGTYAVAFRAQMWALLPDAYLPQLRADINTIVEAFHWDQGGWDYLCRPVARIPRVSPSTRHVALLALHAAAGRGLSLPRGMLHRIEAATIQSQHDDGGWSYLPDESATGSMTAAGVYSLLLAEELHGKHAGRRARSRRRAINQGLAWLDDRFEAEPCPGLGRCAKFPMYWLYSLERMALAGGTRTLNARDWLREAVHEAITTTCTVDREGRWHARAGKTAMLRKQCFALMLLHRATLPLACATAHVTDDAAIDTTTAPGLVRNLLRDHEQECTWQRVTLQSPVDVLLESPMLLLTGNGVPHFARRSLPQLRAVMRQSHGDPVPDVQEWGKLDAYVRRGGLAVVCSKSSGFLGAMESMITQLTPGSTWRTASHDDPLVTILGRPSRVPRVRIRHSEDRILAVVVHGAGDDLLPSIWAWATERAPFTPRLELSRTITPVPPKGVPLAVQFLHTPKHAEPGDAAAFRSWCGQTGRPVSVGTAPLDGACIDAAAKLPQPMLFVTRYDSSVDWSRFRPMLDRGHVLFVTGCGGAGDEVASALGGRLQADHRQPWVTGEGLDFGTSLRTPTWRSFSRRSRRDLPTLDARAAPIARGVLICTPSNISQAMLGRPHWGIHGLDADSARQLVWNLAVFTLRRTSQEPEAYAALKPTTHDHETLDIDDASAGTGGWARRGHPVLTANDPVVLHHRSDQPRPVGTSRRLAMAATTRTRRTLPEAVPTRVGHRSLAGVLRQRRVASGRRPHP